MIRRPGGIRIQKRLVELAGIRENTRDGVKLPTIFVQSGEGLSSRKREMYDRDQFRRIRADITHTAFPAPSKIRKRVIQKYSCVMLR